MQEQACLSPDMWTIHGSLGETSKFKLALQMIPTAGMEKKTAQEVTQEGEAMEEAQTTSHSMEISQCASNECPDQEEDDNDEYSSDGNEITEGLNELALNERIDQKSHISLN